MTSRSENRSSKLLLNARLTTMIPNVWPLLINVHNASSKSMIEHMGYYV